MKRMGRLFVLIKLFSSNKEGALKMAEAFDFSYLRHILYPTNHIFFYFKYMAGDTTTYNCSASGGDPIVVFYSPLGSY